MSFVELWKVWQEARRYTVPCSECGKEFNAKKQLGICPHKSVESFFIKISELIHLFNTDKLDPDTQSVWDLEMAIERARLRKQQRESIRIPDFN